MACVADEGASSVSGDFHADTALIASLEPHDSELLVLLHECCGSTQLWGLDVRTVPAMPACVDDDGDIDVCRQPVAPHVGIKDGPMRYRLALRRETDLQGVGTQLWYGALILSDLLLSRPEIVCDATCIEFGAGCGLVSLIALRQGASTVYCTDNNLDALVLASTNVRANRHCGSTSEHGPAHSSKTSSVRVRFWDWAVPRAALPTSQAPSKGDSAPSCSRSAHGAYDHTTFAFAPKEVADLGGSGKHVALCADVLYDACATEMLADRLMEFLATGRSRVAYVSIEERVYFSAATLQPEVQELPAFLEKMTHGGCRVRFLDLMEVPIFFNYRRSRHYKVLQITF